MSDDYNVFSDEYRETNLHQVDNQSIPPSLPVESCKYGLSKPRRVVSIYKVAIDEQSCENQD